MSRRFRFWSRVFLPLALVGGVVGMGGLAFVLSRYPWAMMTNDFANAKGLRFMAPWPTSPLQEELHSRKKKRLPKAEMERVFQLDLRRMDYINVPVFDVFLHPGVKHVDFDPAARGLGFSEYPWPWLETSRPLGEGNGPQKVSYVVLPQGRGVSLTEGVLLSPGEEMEFTFPLTKLKRYFRFFVLPLNTGTLKINIGPYAWARTFVDDDVNKVQFVSVPINDAATTQMKIVAASSKTFFLGAKITQSEMSGRMPVQVALDSPLWSVNPLLAQAVRTAETVEVDESKIDENAPTAETPKPEEDVRTPVPLESPEPVEAAASVSPLRGGELDSLYWEGNQQVPSPTGHTVALGYNLMVLHMDPIDAEKMHDATFMHRIAPRMSELESQGIVLDNALRLPESDIQAFREVVAGEQFPRFIRDNPQLLKREMARRGAFNLYHHLRNFGYHVLGVAPAPVFGVSPELAWTKDVSAFGKRWLDSNDWNHARRRVKIDRDAQPLKGLEAVFAGKEQMVPPPLVTSDYTSVGRYFDRVARENESFPDWHANEVFMPDDREYYNATVVDYLQNWTAQNKQIRFFAHVWLSSELNQDRPLVTDLAKVIRAKKVSGISSELIHGGVAQIAKSDRTLGQIVDLLKARRLLHRTVLAIVIPEKSKKGGGERRARVVLKVPGLLPKKVGPLSLGIDDLVASSLSVMGVPLTSIPEEGGLPLPGHDLETALSPKKVEPLPPTVAPEEESIDEVTEVPSPPPVVPDLRAVSAFYVAIRPGATGCSPVVWRAETPVFGLETSHPVLESERSGRELTFFPCAIKAPLVTARWFQALEPAPSGDTVEPVEGRLRRESGGAFLVAKSDLATPGLLPRFFLGGRALRFSHPLLSIQNPGAQRVERVLLDEDSSDGLDPGMAYEKLRLGALSFDNELDSPQRVSSILIWRTRTVRRP